MKTSRLAGACLAVLLAAPGGAALAASKTIPMDAFKESCPSPSHFQRSPASVSVPPAASGAWCGVAPVRLPVGSVIQGVTYFRWADGGSITTAYLDRTRPPQGPDSLGAIADNTSTPDHDYYPVELDFNPTADRVVRAGYVYYVTILIQKGAGVSGFKVRFKPPTE